jgi:hypothetical protein
MVFAPLFTIAGHQSLDIAILKPKPRGSHTHCSVPK